LTEEIAELINYGSLRPQDLESGELRHHKHNIYKVGINYTGESVSIQTYNMKPEIAKRVLALIVKLNPANCA